MIKDDGKIKTLVYRPGQEPVVEMIEPNHLAFEKLLDNGWVQHASPWEPYHVWLLRNKYAEEDGLPYNRTILKVTRF